MIDSAQPLDPERRSSLGLSDRLAIHELLARLDHAVDAGDWSTYVAHFAEDGTLDPGWTASVTGRDAIYAWLVEHEGGTAGKRHVVSNIVLDPLEDGVRATSYLTVIERIEAPRVVATALVTDDVFLAGGAWKVRRHQVRVDPSMMKALAAGGAP